MRRASVTGSQKPCKQTPSASEPLLRSARSTGRLAAPQGAEGCGARDRPGRRNAAALPGRSALRRGAALVLRQFLDQGARRVRGGGRARPRGGTMTEQVAGATVRREVTVQAPVERAFSVFTEGIATWWAHEETHNVGPTPADAVMEPFEGGRCYAKAYDGTETDWGRVMTWDPPSRVVFAWLLSPQWEYEPDPSRASEVEVRFEDDGSGGTRVELEHRGFERYAAGGDAMRDQVDKPGGWTALMEMYAGAFEEDAA